MVMKAFLLVTIIWRQSFAYIGDDLWDDLFGVYGSNRVLVCGQGRACQGAAWRRGWTLARATCLEGLPEHSISLVSSGDEDACVNLHTDFSKLEARPVHEVFLHPAFTAGDPQYDLALLYTDESHDVQPRDQGEAQRFDKFEPWIKSVLLQHPQESSGKTAQRHIHPYHIHGLHLHMLVMRY